MPIVTALVISLNSAALQQGTPSSFKASGIFEIPLPVCLAWRAQIASVRADWAGSPQQTNSSLSTPELLGLLGLLGEEALQSQLFSSPRNFDTYGQMACGIEEKGHDRDMQQCHAKIKELRQAYQKAREANQSRVSPKKCCFYKELSAILGGDPTSTDKNPMDTSERLETVASGVNLQYDMVDEEVELQENGGQATGMCSGVASLTGEGSSASADVPLMVSSCTPAEWHHQITQQNKRSKENMSWEELQL
ncbi:zinc finger and SCAN domain-containing protein 32-like [Mauremys mutica]|uniref:zinc finger and SCAN domain-containing protein 32-like n=1 Tax=Mauremys mutica TaxID=74926 RepID=UPI001D16CA9F|nr:zinc finger and SCAN domain-containing protein 32-like [Mauremys mutica]